MDELSAISDNEIELSSFSSSASILSSAKLVSWSKLSFFLCNIHQIKKVNPEPTKKRVFGIPGINPKRNKTHALGSQACLTPI